MNPECWTWHNPSVGSGGNGPNRRGILAHDGFRQRRASPRSIEVLQALVAWVAFRTWAKESAYGRSVLGIRNPRASDSPGREAAHRELRCQPRRLTAHETCARFAEC